MVEDPDNDQITDFISFYSLPSSILKNPSFSTLNVAYSFYNVPNKHKLTDLMKDALILAKGKGYDVFNAQCPDKRFNSSISLLLNSFEVSF